MQAKRSWVFGYCILLLAGCASKPLPRSQPSPLMNVAMPGFESTTLNGNPLDTSQFYGQPLIVSFVASDCAACERTLVAAQATYADLHDVVIVGVFKNQDTDRAAPVVNKHQLKFPVVVDPDGSISKRYQVEDVPTTFVGDSQGRVHWVGGSNLTEDALLAAAESVR